MKLETITNAIHSIDPYDNNCIVLDLFDIFFDFKEKYNFEFNLNRYGKGGTYRFPSLIFEEKYTDFSTIEQDFLNIILNNIKYQEKKNPNAENILFVWHRSYLAEICDGFPYYQKVNPLETINFVKANKCKFIQSLSITTEVIESLDPQLPDITKHHFSGTYSTTYLTISQDSIISYTGKAEGHHPCISKEGPKNRYGFLELTKSNPGIEFPLCGFLYTDSTTTKWDTAAFKENCSVIAFEIYKNVSEIPQSISKLEINSDYNNFINDSKKLEEAKKVVENDAQIVFELPKPAYNGLYNGVSQAFSLIDTLRNCGFNTNAFVCTRRREFIDEIKALICKNPFFNVSTIYKDKVTPYDVLVLPKNIFHKALSDKTYLKEVQSIIAEELVENDVFLKDDRISINKNMKIPCVPVSLKESKALFGKGLSFFYPVVKKYPKYYIDRFNLQNITSLFVEDNFTRGKKSLEILDRYVLANEFASFVNDMTLGNTKDFAKRILIYGVHIKNKYNNNISQICKTENEKYLLLNHLNLFKFDKEFDYWGILDWRKYLRIYDNQRFFNYIIRKTDEDAYQRAGNNQGLILEAVNDIRILEFKVLALALVSLIQEFNEQTLKELANFCMCKNFGQMFLILKGNIVNKTVYPAYIKLENAHLVDYDKKEVIEHYKDFPDIKWTGNNMCELRDVLTLKEVKIYHMPMQIETTQTDFISFSLHSSTNRPSISASDK